LAVPGFALTANVAERHEEKMEEKEEEEEGENRHEI